MGARRCLGRRPQGGVLSTAVVWFRSDLGVGDNPAWAAAAADADTVVALFVIDPRLWRFAGEHRRSQQAAHLRALDDRLAVDGGRLLVKTGDPTAVVPAVAASAGAASVHWNADVTPYAVERDRRVSEALGAAAVAHWGRYVHAPGTLLTKSGCK